MGAAPLLVGKEPPTRSSPSPSPSSGLQTSAPRGRELDFRKYPDRSHMGLLDADSPLTEELVAWTADRFAGKPATPAC